MNHAAIENAVRVGAARGWFPEHASAAPPETRPWPVVLLTALGAWLAAIPLFGFFALLLGPFLTEHGGAYVVGVLALAGAVVVLQAERLPVFVEQLAVPALLTGAVSLTFALFRDLPSQAAAVLLLGVTAVLVALLPRPWLRVLLGAAAAVLFMVLVVPTDVWRDVPLPRPGVALHLALLAWCVVAWLLLAGRLPVRAAPACEAAAAGWFCVVVAGLAAWSGMTFLLPGATGGGMTGELAREMLSMSRLTPLWWVLRALSVGAGVLATFWIARSWPATRQPRLLLVGAVLVALCGLLPALGGALLALSIAATSRRWLLAAAAGVACAWIVGSFYYQLQWALADKAAVLALAGAVLAALAWRASPRAADASSQATGTRRAAVVLAGTGLLVLAVANVSIWQKETLIAQGRPVYVPLAPVDPRSLMQGDYMRLNWRLPADADGRLQNLLTLGRPQVVARTDARGVAEVLRIDSGDEPLAPGELRIELTPKGGSWVLVTDAWFFREGDAQRWTGARFGEFRVDDRGRALLVGLADAQLRPLRAD